MANNEQYINKFLDMFQHSSDSTRSANTNFMEYLILDNKSLREQLDKAHKDFEKRHEALLLEMKQVNKKNEELQKNYQTLVEINTQQYVPTTPNAADNLSTFECQSSSYTPTPLQHIQKRQNESSQWNADVTSFTTPVNMMASMPRSTAESEQSLLLSSCFESNNTNASFSMSNYTDTVSTPITNYSATTTGDALQTKSNAFDVQATTIHQNAMTAIPITSTTRNSGKTKSTNGKIKTTRPCTKATSTVQRGTITGLYDTIPSARINPSKKVQFKKPLTSTLPLMVKSSTTGTWTRTTQPIRTPSSYDDSIVCVSSDDDLTH